MNRFNYLKVSFLNRWDLINKFKFKSSYIVKQIIPITSINIPLVSLNLKKSFQLKEFFLLFLLTQRGGAIYLDKTDKSFYLSVSAMDINLYFFLIEQRKTLGLFNIIKTTASSKSVRSKPKLSQFCMQSSCDLNTFGFTHIKIKNFFYDFFKVQIKISFFLLILKNKILFLKFKGYKNFLKNFFFLWKFSFK